MVGAPQAAPSGRAGVRALKGPGGSDGGRRRCNAASPEPMYRGPRFTPTGHARRPRRVDYTRVPTPGQAPTRPIPLREVPQVEGQRPLFATFAVRATP